jgi:NADH-quinone oxidoreductase subunit A
MPLSSIDASVSVVAYLALFAGVGFVFVFANLLVGRFLRPSDPHAEKQEIYECGEPTIGSSFVQFDLRFYVVALVFIIFDVEVAFLFPWATFFGKTMNFLALARQPAAIMQVVGDGEIRLIPPAESLVREIGVSAGSIGTPSELTGAFQTMATVAIIEVMVFFVILLIGYAYVWRAGALDWIRVVAQERRNSTTPPTLRHAGAADSERRLSA